MERLESLHSTIDANFVFQKELRKGKNYFHITITSTVDLHNKVRATLDFYEQLEVRKENSSH